MAQNQNNLLALDVGRKRIGVAIANTIARLPRPLTTITQSDQIETVVDLIADHDISKVVVGLPRGLDGQPSSQTKEVQQFVSLLKKKINVPVYFQDEAVTSVQAEEELKARRKPYKLEDVDALAATYILEDFLRDKLEGLS